MAARKRIPDLYFENARLMFRNFAGREERYNHEGDRNFWVVVDDPIVAQQMSEDGWNVRILQPRDEDDTPKQIVKVNISYKIFAPKIIVITGRKQTEYTKDMIAALDNARIISVDLTVQPSVYDRDDGSQGISGYLREAYITLEEDHWAQKYEYPED